MASIFDSLRPIVALLLGALLLPGCAPTAPKRSDFMTLGVPLSDERADFVLQSLQRRSAELRTSRSLAECTVLYDGKRYSMRYAVITSNDAIRVEQLAPNGFYTLLLFVSSGGQSLLLDPSAHRASRAAADGSLIVDNLGLPLTEGMLPAVFTGRLASDELTAAHASVRELPDGQFLIVSPTLALFSQADGALNETHLFDRRRGREVLAIRYAERRDFDGVRIPTVVQLESAADSWQATCRLDRTRANQPVSDQLFHPDIPADYSVRE